MRSASWNDEQPTTVRERGLHDQHPVAADRFGAARPAGPARVGAATIAGRDPGIVDIATARRPPAPSAEHKPRELGPYLIYERFARGSRSWVHLGCGAPRG